MIIGIEIQKAKVYLCGISSQNERIMIAPSHLYYSSSKLEMGMQLKIGTPWYMTLCILEGRCTLSVREYEIE